MDPQQELFTKLLIESRKLFDTYDGPLPEEGTQYPFVYMSGSTLSDATLKNAVNGEVTQVIDVWHSDHHKRGTVSAMLLKLKRIAYSVEKDSTLTYGWQLRNVSQQIFDDNTTGATLIHGVLELTYYFS